MTKKIIYDNIWPILSISLVSAWGLVQWKGEGGWKETNTSFLIRKFYFILIGNGGKVLSQGDHTYLFY